MESYVVRAEDSGGRSRVPEVADTSLFLLNESLLPEGAGVTTPLSRLLETREPFRDNDHFRFVHAHSFDEQPLRQHNEILLESRIMLSLRLDCPYVIDHLALRASRNGRGAQLKLKRLGRISANWRACVLQMSFSCGISFRSR